MTTRARGLALAAIIAGTAACAFVAGFFLRQEHTDPQATSAVPEIPAAASPLPPLVAGNDTALRSRIADLEARLRALAASAAAPARPAAAKDRLPELPPPVPFPGDVSPASAPEGFRAAVVALLEKCAPGLKLQDAECSEYPCIAWSTWDREKTPRLDPTGCEAWASTYGKRLILAGKNGPAGDRFVGMYTLPDDPAAASAAKRRAPQRLAALAQAYGIVDR